MKDIKVTDEIKMKVIKYFGYESEYYKEQKEFYISETKMEEKLLKKQLILWELILILANGMTEKLKNTNTLYN